jgi:hypothetical protein
MSIESSLAHYNYCPRCGKTWQPEADYCLSCGHARAETELPESDYLSEKPITFVNFFPRLFSAIENVSLRDLFLMLTTFRVLLTQPFQYLHKRKEGKVVSVFTSMMMATFCGVFKCFQDPVYGPILHRLDMSNAVAESIMQFILYVILASFFGLSAFIISKIGYRFFQVKSVKEDVFVRAMLVLFNVFSFIADAASPFWMILVKNGTIPWGSVDLGRGVLILIYAYILFYALKKQESKEAHGLSQTS